MRIEHVIWPPTRVRSTGFTLVELLLALGLTAMIAATALTVLSAMGQAAEDQTAMRDLLVRHAIGSARVNAAVRSAKMVLAAGSNYLVLWTADANGDAAPNLTELQRIERDAAGANLTSYRMPGGLAPIPNSPYPLASTDFNALTNSVKGTQNFPADIWATELADWTLTLDSADCRQAGVVGYRMALTTGGQNQTSVIGAASLRCP